MSAKKRTFNVPNLLVDRAGDVGDLLDARQPREQPELLELVGDPVERLDQGFRILGRPARPSGGILAPVGHDRRGNSGEGSVALHRWCNKRAMAP